jgi:hypothetical protein
MASEPQARFSPAYFLNGKSVHLQSALVHVGRISGEFGVHPQVVVTKRGDDILSMAARALAEQSRSWPGGGDGAVNAIAGKLAGSDIALGVLPMGTLNHFANFKLRDRLENAEPDAARCRGPGRRLFDPLAAPCAGSARLAHV